MSDSMGGVELKLWGLGERVGGVVAILPYFTGS